ncbi:MAG: hypothetical protein DRR16_09980 [Candidatus Parabeggiatoa sp. nov. 3]|nr:MAG: hypothetical protein DRR00_07790 [Gammaproteobacteria bacterium]RKZ67332.1 MAG: hypothetical protein DRQ99_07040 [Gammaproteobacteria bacterium]RKZ86327.1 MAG: hypothetical protein DRR16_09980 [Gammaproteobacteria bacterium]
MILPLLFKKFVVRNFVATLQTIKDWAIRRLAQCHIVSGVGMPLQNTAYLWAVGAARSCSPWLNFST